MENPQKAPTEPSDYFCCAIRRLQLASIDSHGQELEQELVGPFCVCVCCVLFEALLSHSLVSSTSSHATGCRSHNKIHFFFRSSVVVAHFASLRLHLFCLVLFFIFLFSRHVFSPFVCRCTRARVGAVHRKILCIYIIYMIRLALGFLIARTQYTLQAYYIIKRANRPEQRIIHTNTFAESDSNWSERAIPSADRQQQCWFSIMCQRYSICVWFFSSSLLCCSPLHRHKFSSLGCGRRPFDAGNAHSLC